jgi:two-component system LytT family response regulator
MNTLIVDDNDMARTILFELTSQIGDLVVVGQCAGAMEAYNELQKKQVDLLLLDIEMPGMSGIELARHINNKQGPIVIFTTANTEYAVEAFELDVADYLVKPINQVRFLQAIEKAKEIHKNKKAAVIEEESDLFFIRDNNVLKRIHLNDVLYIEAMGDYIKLYTAKKFYTLHTTLKAFGLKLPPSKFLRIHRSYIIAFDKIDSIDNGAVQIGTKTIVVADAYKAAFQKRLTRL